MMKLIILLLASQLIFSCYGSLSRERVEFRNRELIKYLSKLSQVIEKDRNKYPDFPIQNDTGSGSIQTDYVIAVHKFIEAHPELHSQFTEIKNKEVHMLKELYKMVSNPGLNVSKEFKNKMINKIAHKELYLSGSPTSQFHLQDSMRIFNMINEHLRDTDSEKQFALRIKHVNNRIKQISNMIHESAITHKEYTELMKANQSDRKPPVHIPYPMSHEQLILTWTNEDHMDESSFDEKVFFELHDYNDDGVLDPEELDALFQNTLSSLPPDERESTLITMRQYIEENVDLNKDGMVSLEEFMENVKKTRAESDKHKEWETEKLDKMDGTRGSSLKDYEQALEELNKMKPDPDDIELNADWEEARRDLEKLHEDLTRSPEQHAGGAH